MQTLKAQNYYTNTQTWKCAFKMHVVDNSDSCSHVTHTSSGVFVQNPIKKIPLSEEERTFKALTLICYRIWGHISLLSLLHKIDC